MKKHNDESENEEQQSYTGTKVSTKYGKGVLQLSRYCSADGPLALVIRYDDGGFDSPSVNLEDYGMVPPKGSVFIKATQKDFVESWVDNHIGTLSNEPVAYGPYDTSAYVFTFADPELAERDATLNITKVI